MNRMQSLFSHSRKRSILIVILLQALVTLSCVGVSLANNSTDQTARVYVSIGDGPADLVVLPAGTTRVINSDGNGKYYVRVLVNDKATVELNNLKEEIRSKIFNTDARNSTPAQLDELRNQLDTVEERLEGTKYVSSGECGGEVQDFSSLQIILDWDAQGNRWKVTCETGQAAPIK